MIIRHFCLFYAILAISNLIGMLLFAFISTSSNFNDLLVFNFGNNFNIDTIPFFPPGIPFMYLV